MVKEVASEEVGIVILNDSFFLSVQWGFLFLVIGLLVFLCRVPPSQVENCQQTN